MEAGYILSQAVNALFYSSILFLIASGLNLIFGVMRVLNLAHGAFYMIGAYIMYTVMSAGVAGAGLAAVLGIVAAGLAVAAVGLTVERLLSRVYDKPEEVQLLLTFALILVLDDLVKMIWGTEYKTLKTVPWGSLEVDGYVIPLYYIVTVAVSLGIAGLLWYILSRTTTGKMIRATASYPEVASALGVDTRRIYMLTFILGSAMAGIAGAMASPVVSASPGMGTEAIVLSFAIIVIGGMGSIVGSLVGSLIVGASRTVMAIVFPILEVALIYIIMAIVLLVKPTGLFGTAEVERR